MRLNELKAWVALDEDSRRQFKQDMHSPDALAVEIMAVANSEGGVIFLGVASFAQKGRSAQKVGSVSVCPSVSFRRRPG